MRKYLFLFILLYSVQGLLAQAPRLLWYSVGEGLSQSMVTCFFKDRNGLMWIGTGDGLNSFDGKNFTRYRKNLPNSDGLENSVIRQIDEDRQGNLWISTDKHLYRFLRDEKRFEKLKIDHEGLAIIVNITDEKARIFIQHRGLLTYSFRGRSFDSSEYIPYDPFLIASSVIEKNNETVIAGSNGLFFGKGTSRTRTIAGNIHGAQFSGDKLIFASADTLYIKQDKNLLSIPMPLHEKVSSVLKKDETHIWIGTEHSLFEYNLQSLRLRRIPLDNRRQLLKTLWKDSDGNIWIGTDGNGFAIYAPSRNKFKNFSLDNGDPNASKIVFAIAVTTDRIWHYVYNRGIVITGPDGAIIKEIPGPGNLFTQLGLCMKVFSGRVLLGSRNGLYSIDTDDYRIRKLTRFNDTINEILIANNHIYTCGTAIRRYRFDAEELQHIATYYHPFFRHQVRSALIDRERIIGCNGSWFFNFDLSSGRLSEYTYRADFPRIISFTRNSKNEFLLATYNGIYLFRNAPDLGKADGHFLKGEVIYSILEDRNGAYWCSSNSGIYLLNGNYKLLRHFDNSDGLPSLEFNSRAKFKSGSGELYFGSISGTSSVDPHNISVSNQAPPLVMQKLFVDEKIRESIAGELELKHDENVFAAQVMALEYAMPERIRYSFMLEGWDKDWSEFSENNYVRYAGTTPGSYRLLVRVSNADGLSSKPRELLSVKILPAWWETLWFKAILIAAILVIVVLSVRFFARRKLKKQLELMERKQLIEVERNRISRDMHDDLGAELSKINILSKKLLRKGQIGDGSLKSIAESSERIIGNMREIIWTLNSGNDELRSTIAYLRDYASSFLDAKGISLHFTADVETDVVVGSVTRRNLLLIYKEALNNIAKHSAATEAEISFLDNVDCFYVSIKDNGKGFTRPDEKRFSNGMINMQSRADEILAELFIRSERDRGTVIELKIPISKKQKDDSRSNS